MDPGRVLQQGELIWKGFDPALGREQAGRRPALVVSDTPFNQSTGLAFVCPITSRIRPYPSSVILPPGLPISGEILLSHMRSIDVMVRPVRLIGTSVPIETANEVKDKLRRLFTIPL